jgi:ADP-heptose:LPS heptosyltransferase
LALPLLQGLSQRWPDAETIVLGKSSLTAVLQGERVTVINVDAPWTAFQGKYRFWSTQWRAMFRAIGDLRARQIDLWVTIRFDPRDTVFARLCRPKRIMGMAQAGGRYWLWRDIGYSGAGFSATYGGAVAAHAVALLTDQTTSIHPRFSVAESRRKTAQASFGPNPYVVVAFGASHPIREWTPAKVAEVIDGLVARGLYVVVVDNPSAYRLSAGPDRVRFWQGDLNALLDLIAGSEAFVGSDSGPMHMAAALARPLVAAFGPGSLERFGPSGAEVILVAHQPMPCRPCFDACIYKSPLCLDAISPRTMLDAVDQLIVENKVRIG